MNACREENEVEKNSSIFILIGKLCDALYDAKTKLQNADYVLGNASICVYVKSVFVLCNMMRFVIISGVYLLMW
jgi:Trk-type K+ transport system membrane component